MKTLAQICLTLLIAFTAGCAEKRVEQQQTQTPVETPQRQPFDPHGFIADYRIGHYLNLAASLQRMSENDRKDKLRAMSNDPRVAPQLFPLCKMLFEPERDNGVFRRPIIGAPTFIGSTTYDHWPKEPITIYQGVPIMVVTGYNLDGKSESPGSYLEYCFVHLQWRREKFTPVSKERIKQIVARFIEANPKFANEADRLRAQAE